MQNINTTAPAQTQEHFYDRKLVSQVLTDVAKKVASVAKIILASTMRLMTAFAYTVAVISAVSVFQALGEGLLLNSCAFLFGASFYAFIGSILPEHYIDFRLTALEEKKIEQLFDFT